LIKMMKIMTNHGKWEQYLISSMMHMLNITEHSAVDEITVLLKGRVTFRQHIPKQYKWFWMKMYTLCNSKEYTYNRITYSETSFHDLGFYIFHEFMYFLHGSGQIPITIMLNFNGFYFSWYFLTLHAFPEFALHFSSPGYENLPDFTFCSSIFPVSYPRQRTSFPVQSENTYQVADKWLQVICVNTTWFHYGLACKTGFFLCWGTNSLCVPGHIWTWCILVQQ
jgi:hypothetical protein